MRTSKFDRVWWGRVHSYLSYIGTIVSNFIGTTISSPVSRTLLHKTIDHHTISIRGIYGLGELIFGDLSFNMKNLWPVQSTYVGSVATMVPESSGIFKYDIVRTSSFRG
jgi:hypothetical protein